MAAQDELQFQWWRVLALETNTSSMFSLFFVSLIALQARTYTFLFLFYDPSTFYGFNCFETRSSLVACSRKTWLWFLEYVFTLKRTVMKVVVLLRCFLWLRGLVLQLIFFTFSWSRNMNQSINMHQVCLFIFSSGGGGFFADNIASILNILVIYFIFSITVPQ